MSYVKRKILNSSTSQTISASSTESIIIAPTSWKIKTLNITSGPNSTVQDIKIDGKSIGVSETNNIETDFGEVIAQKEIEVSIQNTNTGGESNTVDIKGVELE